jgi:hypothetical protein
VRGKLSKLGDEDVWVASYMLTEAQLENEEDDIYESLNIINFDSFPFAAY